MLYSHCFCLLLIFSDIGKCYGSEVQLLEELPPYSVVVLCLGSNDNYDIKIAAFNEYHQIMLMGAVSSKEKDKGWVKIGEKMTSGIAAKIVSHGEGKVTWEYMKTTVGASLIVIGDDEKVRDFEKLPKGLHKTINQPGYLLIGQVMDLKDLPLNVELLSGWTDVAEIEKMASLGQILFPKANGNTKANNSNDTRP